jgi:UDP-2,4-diacetamido-2,4,6-trideoxy-beta-L-altropyranose hydrolase
MTKVIFRCDASINIGTGHVMRCLTLADALQAAGAVCHFMCRAHEGHLLEVIRQRGHQANALAITDNSVALTGASALAHAEWLGATQAEDAAACSLLLNTIQPDWIVVDHYALDAHWETAVSQYCKRIMVIDDLADRQHHCEVLLDQTFGRDKQYYIQRVPTHCKILCGTDYAILRPEFFKWREYSLTHRKSGTIEQILINLGGVDKDNVTLKILKHLQQANLPKHCQIIVVMGATAPWVDSVIEQADTMPWQTEVKTGVSNMAELMANSDLAIGAAGSTSWERCCLGLPTLMLVLADNQKQIAANLEKVKAVTAISLNDDFDAELLSAIDDFVHSPNRLSNMSQAAANTVDGLGASRIIKTMLSNDDAC